jgi:hypothetical protein
MAIKGEARTVGADPSLETNRDRTTVDSKLGLGLQHVCLWGEA